MTADSESRGGTSAATAGPGAEGKAKARRLQSLDLLRGLTIAGMVVVNGSAVFEASGRPVFEVLLHKPWIGFTAADAVFPAFITMVGVSLAVATKAGAPALPPVKILWRAVRLFILGLLLVNMFAVLAPAIFPPRIPGVLQRIGLVYALAAFLYPVTATKTRALLAGAILLAYWGICLLPIPDGSAVNLAEQGHSFVCWVDRAVFGNWVFGKGPAGYDPEGIMGTLPALAQALIGTVAGDYLRRNLPIGQAARKIALAGAGSIVLGLAWSSVYPISKPLWTGSFVLLSAGITLVGLAAFHYLCDGKPAPAKGGPLGSLGRNSIAAYTYHFILLMFVGSAPFQAAIDATQPILGAKVAALVPIAMFFLIVWAPLALLDRKGWYLRI